MTSKKQYTEFIAEGAKKHDELIWNRAYARALSLHP